MEETRVDGCLDSQFSPKDNGKTLEDNCAPQKISELVRETHEYFWLLLSMSCCELMGLDRMLMVYWREMEVLLGIIKKWRRGDIPLKQQREIAMVNS